MPIGKAKRLRTIVCVLLAGLAGAAGAAAARAGAMPPRTLAESSGFAQTGRYAEVESLCKAYATSWPRTVRCEEFGRSPEGRPLLAMVVSRSGTLDPAEARRRRVPVMLFQGGIHAGEIDGKDAGFMVLRDLLDSPPAPDPLLQEVLVFVPVFNVDGHERFGRWNRPNQVGPSEMGWRTTAQNLNLNRDYMKADAPEMQAMLRLLARWDPILYVDLHVTDGADFQPDVSVQVEPLYTGDTVLRQQSQESRIDMCNTRDVAARSIMFDHEPRIGSRRLLEVRSRGVANKTQGRQAALELRVEEPFIQS